MALKDTLSSALGSIFSYGKDVFADALKKSVAEESMYSDAGSMAMVIAGQKPSPLPPPPAQDPSKGLLYDPFALIDQLGFRDRPSALTYTTLRDMSRKVPTVIGIEQTRLTQVSAFATPQIDKRDPGFEIRLRDPRTTPSRQDRKRMIQLTDWILQTGSTWGPGRDDFQTFLLKLTRDSLELDQATFEIVRNRKKTPAEFYALDAATIRLADTPPGSENQVNSNLVKFVQVYDEIIIGEFTNNDLCFGIRNPRSDIRANGYGYSEMEMLISIVTATLWAFEYNKRYFQQGTTAKGILNFKGSVPNEKLDSFRRQWIMTLSGTSNSHKTPMTNVDDLQWINLSQTNRDMEFSAWMDWLIKITCAVYQFDPAELNFNYGNSGQSQQVFATPADQKLKQSKDKGLRPLLDKISQWLNVHLIWQLDPRYKLVFVGLDAKSADQAIDMGKKKVTYLMTVDEIRAEDDLPPLPEGKGECILDPNWLQFSAAKDQAALQAQEQAQADQQAQLGPMGEPVDPSQAPPPEEAVGNEPQQDPNQNQASDSEMATIFGTGYESSNEDETDKSLVANFETFKENRAKLLQGHKPDELKKSQPTVKKTVITYELKL